MSYMALYRKWRPGIFEDVKGQEHIVTALRNQIKADRIIRALLRYKTIPATKGALEAMGYPVGNAVFPMKRYTDAEKQQILADLKAAGL